MASEALSAYDFIVIGGGSGGLAAAKEAVSCGAKKVVVFDYVKPTEHGTKWGLGGTCVNVGCIPKKLMHYAACMGPVLHNDAKHFGWDIDIKHHDWKGMVQNVQAYVKKLNFSYKVGLMSKSVQYINALAHVESPQTVSYTDPRTNEKKLIRGQYILIAVGGRPHIPSETEIPGAMKYCITSDDLFSWKESPGKTLVVGASYIALECAGFLIELGYPTTVAVRSILLRGFDRQCSDKVGSMMKEMGARFLQSLPQKITKKENGKLAVEFDNPSFNEEFDTILYATGRRPDTKNLGLEEVGVKMTNLGKIVANNEQSSVPSIFVVGDALSGGPELTPVAIKAGELLARRLFGGSAVQIDYSLIPTTIFTPFEYGVCGLSEEVAIEKFGAEDVEVFLYEFSTLELAAAHREKVESARADELDVELSPNSFCKLVCVKSQDMRVVGFHFVGLNAGEITQGYALALRLGAKKADFDTTIGIHPTDAEAFHSMSVTKSSGASWVAAGGCGGGRCG